MARPSRRAELRQSFRLLEEWEVKEIVLKHGARDTTIRGTAMAELEAMTPRFSQWLPGQEIPEKHWMYRWAKKWWFNDFAAYAKADHDGTAKAKARELAGAA